MELASSLASLVSAPPTRKKRTRQAIVAQTVPRKRKKPIDKDWSPPSPKSQDSTEVFSVTDIIDEKLIDDTRYFLIIWAGKDPNTDKPWEHSYEPVTELGNDLLEGWELKKAEIAKSTGVQAATRTIHFYLKQAGVTTEEYKKQKKAGTLETSILARDSPCYKNHQKRSASLDLTSSSFTDLSHSIDTSQQLQSQSQVDKEDVEQTLAHDTPQRNQLVHIVLEPLPAGFNRHEYRTVTASQLQNASIVHSQSQSQFQSQSQSQIGEPPGKIIADSQSLGESLETQVQFTNHRPASPATIPITPPEDSPLSASLVQRSESPILPASGNASASTRSTTSHYSLDSVPRESSTTTFKDLGEFESQVPFVPSQAGPWDSPKPSKTDVEAVAAQSLLQSLGSYNNKSIIYVTETELQDTSSLSLGTELPNTFSALPRPPSQLSSLISTSLSRAHLSTTEPGNNFQSSKMDSGDSSLLLADANQRQQNYSDVASNTNDSSHLIAESSLSQLVESAPVLAPGIGHKRSLSASSQNSSASQSMKRTRRSEEPVTRGSDLQSGASEHMPRGGQEQMYNQTPSVRFEALENQLRMERQMRIDLEKDIGQLQTRFEIQSGEHLVLQSELSKIKVSLEDSTTRATRLLKDLQEVRNERSSMRTELDELRQALRDSKVPELENLADLTKDAERASQLEKRLELMQGDLAYTQDKYQSASAAAQANSEEADSLRAENEELREKASGEQARLRALFQDKTNDALVKELERKNAQVESLERALHSAGEEEKRLMERLDREERRAGMSLNTRSSSPGPVGQIGGRGLGQLSATSAALGSASSSRAASPAASGAARGTFKTSPLQNSLNAGDHD